MTNDVLSTIYIYIYIYASLYVYVYVYMHITLSPHQMTHTQNIGVSQDLEAQDLWCFVCGFYLSSQREYTLHLQSTEHNLRVLCRQGKLMAFCKLCNKAMAVAIHHHRVLPEHVRLMAAINATPPLCTDEYYMELHRPPVEPTTKAQVSQCIMTVANNMYIRHVDIHRELFFPPDEEDDDIE
jgi:hypothetical protein